MMSTPYSIRIKPPLIPDRNIPGILVGLTSFRPFLLKYIQFLLIIMNIATPLQAETGSDEPVGLDGPTVITASRLSADGNANTALFEGSVVAKNNEMTLYSDSMMVYYSTDNKIDRINAKNNVKLVKKDRVVTSETATYFAGEKKIVFEGNPRAVEGQNVITGSKMIYLIDEDRSIVENSKVYLRHDSMQKDTK